MVQRDDLMTDVLALTYDFRTLTGTLTMAEGTCCDMRGCIRFFEQIDSRVRRINTFAGSETDTAYERVAKEDWVAHLPPDLFEVPQPLKRQRG